MACVVGVTFNEDALIVYVLTPCNTYSQHRGAVSVMGRSICRNNYSKLNRLSRLRDNVYTTMENVKNKIKASSDSRQVLAVEFSSADHPIALNNECITSFNCCHINHRMILKTLAQSREQIRIHSRCGFSASSFRR